MGDQLDDEMLGRLPDLHAEAYAPLRRRAPAAGRERAARRPDRAGASLGDRHERGRARAGRARALLGLPEDVPMVTRDQVRYAKPDPDLFLTAAARLGVDIGDGIVVGDSVWDLLAARRAGALGHRPAVGRLRPRGARSTLARSASTRIPATCCAHLDEVGVRRPG